MKNLFLALTIGLAAMGCIDIKLREGKQSDEYHPQLPPITQTGANTFGAVINGKVMVPRSSTSTNWSFGPGPRKSAYYQYSNEYEIVGARDQKGTNRGSIYIYLENKSNNYPIAMGTYVFEDSNGAPHNYTVPKGIMMNYYLGIYTYLSIANTGSITITRNDDEVISGTFSCKLRNKDNSNDIIEIKDGRFDFNKSTINTTNFY